MAPLWNEHEFQVATFCLFFSHQMRYVRWRERNLAFIAFLPRNLSSGGGEAAASPHK